MISYLRSANAAKQQKTNINIRIDVMFFASTLLFVCLILDDDSLSDYITVYSLEYKMISRFTCTPHLNKGIQKLTNTCTKFCADIYIKSYQLSKDKIQFHSEK